MKPNLLLCGVRKAGTTSLFYYLSQHPEIGACRIKEPSYFTPLKYGRPLKPLADYLALFSHCRDEQYWMEASPNYFSGGADIAYPIAKTLERPWVVVILRNPVDTFLSNFNFLRSRAKLHAQTSIAEYVRQCEDMHRLGTDSLWENRDYNSIRAGMYWKFLPAWQDAIGDRFKVLFFEDLVADPHRVVRSVCDWLRISTAPTATLDYSLENKTEQYRIRWLQRVALACNRRCGFFFRRFHSLKKGLRTAYYLVNRDSRGNDSLPPPCKARLEAIFAEPNRRLAAQLVQLGHDRLPAWLVAAQTQCPSTVHGAAAF